MITRLLIGKDRTFVQRDNGAVDTHLGRVEADAVNSAADGAVVLSNRREAFTILTPTWLDRYQRMKRGAQIMTLKDLGFIAAACGIGPDSSVGDAGAGTGAAAIFFSRIAKHVHSFDLRADHLELAKKNAELMGCQNVTFEERDIYEGVPDNQYDVFVLDNPTPWKALSHIIPAMKIGGHIVSYTPTILQASEFANAVHQDERLHYRKTVELIERQWNAKDLSVRPSSDAIGHTGFLVFCRRIR